VSALGVTIRWVDADNVVEENFRFENGITDTVFMFNNGGGGFVEISRRDGCDVNVIFCIFYYNIDKNLLIKNI